MDITLDIDLEDADGVLVFLTPAIRAIETALDHGVALADLKFNDLDYDPYLWTHIARYGARQHLATLTPEGWERGRNLAYSGIEIKRIPLVVRAYKAQHGGPPHPGHSAARQAFWSQQAQRLPLKFGTVVIPTVTNFILDWDVNAERELSLALSKPVATWKYRQVPKLEWRRPVDLSADELAFAPVEDEVLEIEPVFDPAEFETEKGLE